MSYPIHYVPAGDVLPIFFDTYAGGTGASITMSGLAVTDIEIYKDGSITQRASDAGYTLLDTDGIDFDGITGIHGFSIDTGDNTDAGFYTVGAWFHVVVSAVTVDAQTVNFIAAAFRLMPAEGIAGKPKVDVDGFGGSAGTFSGGRPEVNTTHAAGTAWGSGAITAASIAADAITAAKIADGAIDAATFAAGAITATVIADNAIDAGAIASGAITAAKFAAGAIDAAAIATGAIDADALAADAATEIANAVWDTDCTGRQTQGTFGQAIGDPVADTNTLFKAVVTDAAGATVGVDVVAVKADTAAILTDTAVIGATGEGLTSLATQASVNTIDDFLDTEIAAILAAVDTEVAAIKAVTDLLPNAGALTNLDAAISTRATPAQVNAEVLDVLNVDTFAQPGQGAPAATNTIRAMLAYLYKAWRNRTTQTASEYALYNDDAATVDHKATFADDATTADRGEVITGP